MYVAGHNLQPTHRYNNRMEQQPHEVHVLVNLHRHASGDEPAVERSAAVCEKIGLRIVDKRPFVGVLDGYIDEQRIAELRRLDPVKLVTIDQQRRAVRK